MITSWGIDLEKLAMILCKLKIDPFSSDSPQVIWRQMNIDNKAVFMNDAKDVADFMGWKPL